jgi:hypothetical protein
MKHAGRIFVVVTLGTASACAQETAISGRVTDPRTSRVTMFSTEMRFTGIRFNGWICDYQKHSRSKNGSASFR